MKRNIGIVLCSMMLGLGMTGCLIIPRAMQSKQAVEYEEPKQEQDVRTVAWWSAMYEIPNPDHLPVQVRFQWLKGLE